MVSDAWQPPLTDTQRSLWRALVTPHDPHVAFSLIMRLFRTEERRPAPPAYQSLYRRALANSVPVSAPQARDEQPWWVRGWYLSRNRGDLRAWPEQREGYWKLGYDWDDDAVMPQEDRLRYMREAGMP